MLNQSQPQISVQPAQPVISTRPCRVCKYVLQESWYFCPNCGKKLKMKPLSTSFGRQIIVYFISFFIFPFGIFPAINYLRQHDTNAKLVGVTCLLMTILSCIVITLFTNYLFNIIQKELTNQIAPLQGLGY